MDPQTQLEWLTRLKMRELAAARLPHFVVRKGFEEGRPTVLCLTRSHFIRDIEQLRLHTNLNYLGLTSMLLTPIQQGIVPWGTLNLPETQTWFAPCQQPEAVEARKKTYHWGRRMLAHLRKRHAFDAILTANVDYWQEDALQAACAEVGLPFLVLSKEHYVSGHFAAKRIAKCKASGFRFKGAGVAVFGPCTVQTLVEPCVCREDQVWMTGCPRFDEWRDTAYFNPSDEKRRFVTMLSFSRVINIDSTFGEAIATFARASMKPRDPGVEFVIKCKNGDDKKRVQKIMTHILEHRIKLTVGQSVAELLSQSRLIVGFNSTAMIEALLGQAALCVPFWGDTARDLHDLVFQPSDPDTQKAVIFVRSQQELESKLAEAAIRQDRQANRDERLLLLRKYYHHPESGTCSGEVENFIRHYIQSSLPNRIA